MTRRTLDRLGCCWGLAILLAGVSLHAQEAGFPMSIEEYTRRAIEKGVAGQQNALTFESAGYVRQIAFRQTDSPTLRASASGDRSQVDSGSGIQTSDTGQADLTLNQPLPTGTLIQATGQTTGNRQTGVVNSETNLLDLRADITQPLYIFVKNPVRRTRRQATLSFENAKGSFDATLLALRSQARNFYYQVLLGEESIEVEKRRIISSNKLLDITEALVETGKIAPVETMRAKIRLQTNERQLQNTVLSRDQAILNAKNFIAVPFDQPIRFSSPLQFKPLNVSLNRLIEYALVHRPELRNLRRSQEAARLDYEASKEPTRPTLELNAGYGERGTSSDMRPGWNAGGTANWLVFDSFITRDQASVARIGLTIAGLNLSDGERRTQLDVRSVYLDAKNSEKQIIEFASSREQARRNVDVVRLRFRNGLERLIDVFDAENDMRNLDNEYLNLLVNFNRSKDALSQLIGTEVETVQ